MHVSCGFLTLFLIGGGGSGKGRASSQSQNVVIKKTKKAEVEASVRVILRTAIFNTDGSDRNPLLDLGPMCNFSSPSLPVPLRPFEFATVLSRPDLQKAFRMAKDSLEASHEESGFGWDDDEKKEELRMEQARFVLVRGER